MKKRSMSLLLVMILVVSLLPTAALAEDSRSEGVLFSWVNWDKDVPSNSGYCDWLDQLNWSQGIAHRVVFYGRMQGDLANYEVTEVSVTGGSSVTVKKCTVDGFTYWELQCAKTGKTTLSFTVGTGNNATEVSATVNVTLPKTGFYSSTERDEETFLSGTVDVVENQTIYVLTKKGVPANEQENYTIELYRWENRQEVDYSALLTTEWVLRKNTNDAYDLKLDLSALAADAENGYYHKTHAARGEAGGRQ